MIEMTSAFSPLLLRVTTQAAKPAFQAGDAASVSATRGMFRRTRR